MTHEEIVEEFKRQPFASVAETDWTEENRTGYLTAVDEIEPWLRQTLTTYRAQVLEEERGRIKKRVVALGWSAENETPEAIRILKEIYDLLEHPTN